MTPQKRKFLLDAVIFKFQLWGLPDLLLLWTFAVYIEMHAGTKLDAHVALCLPPFNDIRIIFVFGGTLKLKETDKRTIVAARILLSNIFGQ